VHLALIGAGSRGDSVLRGFARLEDVRFVAVCDPFVDRREGAKAFLEGVQGKGTVTAYNDFREALGRKDLDAVVCATCDHWHVPVAVAAARAGKDMYVEKPLGPSLAWAKTLRKEVARKSCIFQYGTQQRSDERFRSTVELVRNGHLGAVSRVDAWCIDGTRAEEWFDPSSKTPEPVPRNLDYDLWLGPAPEAPYSSRRVHREGSFHTYDYSLGFIAGWGAHPLDIAQWGLGADGESPVSYEGTGRIPTTGGLFSTVYQWDVRCRYENGVELHFLSHRPAEAVVTAYRKRWSDHGTTFFGAKGWISVDRLGVEASDPGFLALRPGPRDERLPASRGHDADFIAAVKSRKQPLSPLEAAIRSDTISHLADIAIRTGRTIRWDPRTEEIVGDEAAGRLLTRPMRAPYGL
jgi:predicted dehydrogenase